MELKLDLHIHSEASADGRMPIAEIVEAAKRRGLDGAAICDHDVLYRPSDAAPDFLLIPGEEFSTPVGHLLGLFLTGPIRETDPERLLDAIHAQGGLAVMAHPFARSADEARLLAVLPKLDGVEVWNGRANRKRRDANERARAFAAAHGLPAFAGSDAHLPREIGNGYVTVQAEAKTPEAVRAALLRPGNPVGGTEGHSLDVARSQRTKLARQGAGLKKRLKWLAFAAKCALEDLLRRRCAQEPGGSNNKGGSTCRRS